MTPLSYLYGDFTMNPPQPRSNGFCSLNLISRDKFVNLLDGV